MRDDGSGERESEGLCQRALGQILAFADTIDKCAYTDSHHGMIAYAV